MPSGAIKNLLYRAALPLSVPPLNRNLFHPVAGHPLNHRKAFIRILSRHRVQGSALLLSNLQSDSRLLADSALAHFSPAEDTYFRVASITKWVTALVVMRLWDQGRLDLDRPVSDYTENKDLQAALADITLRHLLSHTAGLTDPSDLEKMLLNKTPLPAVVFPNRAGVPGQAFQYSNLGYGIIGSLLESVTGLPVSRVFDETLFQPFALEGTLEGCSLPPKRVMPVIRLLPRQQAVRITFLGSKPLENADPLLHYGHTAGSLYITPRALASLLTAFIQEDQRLLSPKARSEMLRPHGFYGSISPTLSYGLGLLFIQDPVLSESRIIGHQGFAYGCADGIFYEESTGNMMISLNGGGSEARAGRLGLLNRDLMKLAFRKELPSWNG